MDRETFITRLMWLATTALVLVAIARVLLGGRTFSIYGIALVALFVLPLLMRLLSLRLAYLGGRRRLAAVCVLPAMLLAAGHIAYWAMFFSGSAKLAVMLGFARTLAVVNAGPLVALLPALAAIPVAWLVVKAARRADDTRLAPAN